MLDDPGGCDHDGAARLPRLLLWPGSAVVVMGELVDQLVGSGLFDPGGAADRAVAVAVLPIDDQHADVGVTLEVAGLGPTRVGGEHDLAVALLGPDDRLLQRAVGIGGSDNGEVGPGQEFTSLRGQWFHG